MLITRMDEVSVRETAAPGIVIADLVEEIEGAVVMIAMQSAGVV